MPKFVTPQDIVAAIAVDVAGADDLPASVELVGGIGVVGEGTASLAEPLGEMPCLIAPQDIAPAVAVEIVADVGDAIEIAIAEDDIGFSGHFARIVIIWG